MKDPRAVLPLIAAVKSKDGAVRGEAARALGRIKDPRAVQFLITTLNDPDRGMQQQAAIALGSIQDPRAVEPLIAVLKGSDGWASTFAAESLGKLKDPRAVDSLLAALSKDPYTRMHAAESLVQFNDPRAVNHFLAALKKRDAPEIVGANVFFIERGEPGSEDELIEALRSWGYEPMGLNLLTCGNAKLEDAGRSWLTKNNRQLKPLDKPVLWGSAQQTQPFSTKN
jgi:HEAT repeat protein